MIGPNGAGKSTLMNLISGIYDVDEGHIYFEGKDITKVPAWKRAQNGYREDLSDTAFSISLQYFG